MNPLIAWLLFFILALVAALHFLWASGSTWPVANRDEFVRSFIGSDSPNAMPGALLTSVVACLILVASVVPLWRANIVSLPLPEWALTIGMWALFGIFLLRGLSTYALPMLSRTEPFRRLDRHYYAPLCLIIAVGFALGLSQP